MASYTPTPPGPRAADTDDRRYAAPRYYSSGGGGGGGAVHIDDTFCIVLRCAGSVILGLPLLVLLSGGSCVITAILVVAQGGLWLSATATPRTLAAATHRLRGLHDDCGCGSGSEGRCCGTPATQCCTGKCLGELDNIRGLAIAAMVFALLDIVTVTVLAYIASMLVDNTNRFCPWPQNRWCGDPFTPAGVWMLYNVGNGVLAIGLHVALSVLSLQLVSALKGTDAAASDAPPPHQLMTYTSASSYGGATGPGANKGYGVQAAANPMWAMEAGGEPAAPGHASSAGGDAMDAATSPDWAPAVGARRGEAGAVAGAV